MSGMTVLTANNNIQVRELNRDAAGALLQASRRNGLDEIMVRTTSNRDVVVYGENLRPLKGKDLPQAGAAVSLVVPGQSKPIEGRVLAVNPEPGMSRQTKAALIAGGAAVAGAAIGIALTRSTPVHTGSGLTMQVISAIGGAISDVFRTTGNALAGAAIGGAVGGTAAWIVHNRANPSDQALREVSRPYQP